mgnify:CR=1 FL=1
MKKHKRTIADTRKLTQQAVKWARMGAYYNPGIMYTAIVDGQLHSYETDENMEIKARNT